MKTCNICKQTKNESAFYRDKGMPDGLRKSCKACKNAKTAVWRQENRDYYNASMRRYNRANYKRLRLQRYKLAESAHVEMLAAQGGVCAICKNPPRGTRPLAVDHCHNTKRVRGLLCFGCNRAIAILDKPELLAKAMAYISKD